MNAVPLRILSERTNMARQKGTPAKPPASGTAPSAPEPEPRAAYFLSLTVENVRCFGPKQTLDLSDGNGKPAPWTIILGVNGTGKTTLLQSLAGFEILSGSPTWAGEFTRSFLSVAKSHAPQSRFLHWLLESHAGESTLHSFLRSQEKAAAWEIQYTGSEINTSKNNLTSKILVNSGDEGIVQSHSGLTPRCYAYGAGRRVGSTVFRESEPDDPTATLFSDRAELRSAGEWLLQLDYAAAKAPKDKDAQYRLAQA
ncbi:MAG TPA: AAA family ATPase, partial [Gemmata sp.]